MTERLWLAVGCATAIAIPWALRAQEIMAPPPAPPRHSEAPAPETGPAAAFLAQEYGISIDEAQERIALQSEIAKLVEQVKKSEDPGISGIWVQHRPVFQIFIGYTDPDDRKLLQFQIPPKIRNIVKLKKLPHSRRENQQLMEQLNTSLEALGVAEKAIYIEEDTSELVAEIPPEQLTPQVRQILQSARKSIKIKDKRQPKPTAGSPKGVQSGDYIDGGHYYWFRRPLTTDTSQQVEDSKGCSFAFEASYAGMNGILTAGHCNQGPDGTGYWHAINNHWVELPSPEIARWASGTKYDFQFHNIAGYLNDTWTYYFNQAAVVGLPSSGFLYVTGKVGYYGLTKGMTVCKSGRVTGISCGNITSGNYPYNGAYGWIKVERASGMHLGRTGDSGGAVFSEATRDGQAVNAYGIVTAAQVFSNGSSEMIFTPIDYMEDYGVYVRIR